MKKKLLRIFLFIITLLSCIVPSELNGPRRVEANTVTGGHLYFKAPTNNWTSKTVQILVGHGSWSQGYQMTKVSNTSLLYHVVLPSWSDATEWCIIAADSVWGGEGNSPTNRRKYATYYTNKSTYGLKGSHYLATVNNNTEKDGTLTVNWAGDKSIAENVDLLAYSYYSEGGSDYTLGSIGGTVTISSYYLDYDNNKAVQSESTFDTGTNSSSFVACMNLSVSSTFKATSSAGYDFVGWFDSTTSSTAVSTSSSYSVIVTADKTLYARFTEKSYSVTYNYDTNSNEKTSSEVIKYHTTNLTLNGETYTRTGYEQTGWSTSAGGSKAYNLSGTYSTNQAVSLYPFWTANTHSITLNTNGGTYRNDYTAPTIHTYDIQTTLPTSNDITKIGYTFSGWYNNQELSGSSVKVIPAKTDNTTEYWLKWTPNVYTISFNVNGGSGSFDSVEVTYDQTYKGKLPNSEPTPPSEQYEFGGWFIGDTKIEETSTVKITENTELVAKWVEKISVIFNANDGQWEESETSKIKYYFKGEKYNFNGGTFPENPTKYGYGFDGWFTAKDGGEKVLVSDTLISYGTHTLYAHWYALPCELTFDVNGGNSSHPSKTIYYDGTYGDLPTPTKIGYKFSGWFTSAEDGEEVTSSTIVQTIPTQILYAHWTPITYTISYNANIDKSTGTMANTTNCIYAEEFKLPTNAFEKDGYNFVGWTTNEDGTGNLYADGASVSNLTSEDGATVTLYAKWTPITYTIKLDSNNESGVTTNKIKTYDSNLELSLTSFAQDGYEIVGWSLTPDGQPIYTTSLYEDLSTIQGDTITLYAIWDIKTYNITYSYADELNDVTHNNKKGYTILTDSFTLTEPTRENYTFAGWTCAALNVNEPTKDLVIEKGNHSDLTIVANWDQKVTFYIDMGIIYEQFPITTHSIDNPIIHLWQNGGNVYDSYGDLKLNRVGETTIYTIDIYFTKNNVIHKNIDAKSVEYVDMIMFGYDETLWSSGAVTHKNTETLNLHLDGTNNGDEYVLKIENNKIVWGEWEVGKTYHIYNITHLYSWNDQSNKWFSCSYYESLEPSAPGTITFIVHYDWSGMGDMYIGGIKATKNSTAKTYTSVVTTAINLTGFEINFEQNGSWYHVDEDGDVNTQSNNTTSKLAHSQISSITLIDAPRVNYYDGNELVHVSSYIESNQVHFIEKEGYKLEGWYTTPTFEQGTKFEKGYNIVGSINIYANYVVAHDYYIYVEAKNIGWDMENMSVYKWSDYFSNHNNSWPGSKDDIVYLGNGMYRVFVDASKSFDHLIFTDNITANANGNSNDKVQTQDIDMTPTMSYYVITNELVTSESGENAGKKLNKVYSEKTLDNDIYAQKNSSNTESNEFRFTSGLENYNDLVKIEKDTIGKEFGYKFIFINGDECYVGYWNFTTNTMLDCVRYDGTLYEAQNEGYKGYYSLTLTDDINFKYSHYNQIIVVACYRDNAGNTQIIKAQEYNIVGTGTDVQLYKIER